MRNEKVEWQSVTRVTSCRNLLHQHANLIPSIYKVLGACQKNPTTTPKKIQKAKNTQNPKTVLGGWGVLWVVFDTSSWAEDWCLYHLVHLGSGLNLGPCLRFSFQHNPYQALESHRTLMPTRCWYRLKYSQLSTWKQGLSVPDSCRSVCETRFGLTFDLVMKKDRIRFVFLRCMGDSVLISAISGDSEML